ncbi:class F sortase [Streptomyces pakalii]|uniref:Uncharacterized protein n=1 Tax=Streptomyces pakalii TaxID=3036494 RepID=A0ABT7DL45_9ACTN|nr:hypothetical protein [Streptomyces pakalii]MDJ1645201.1 hypothetical protein [Streptomyces pakalii]
MKTYTKDQFSDDKAHGEAERPELRLPACGGGCDEKAGHSANVVVIAHLSTLKTTAWTPGSMPDPTSGTCSPRRHDRRP